MKARCTAAVLIALLALLIASCSGTQATNSPAEQVQAPPAAGPALPSPAELEDGNRSATIADAGDYSLALDQIYLEKFAAIDGDELVLDPLTGDTSWALYQVSGFDGDMLPLSARVEVSGGTSQYLVGFADFDSGRWAFSGPYSGTSAVDLPVGEGVNHPYRFTSQFGNLFMAVVSQQAPELRISRINLEVFGGNAAPAPPSSLVGLDGTDSIILSWNASPDADAPDFAGYLLERAPFNSGSYAEVTRGLFPTGTYDDEEIVPEVAYRYRISAIDTDGNHSDYAYDLLASAGQFTGEVVPVLDMPRGPLYGPVNVTFDLSGSYVAGGGTIDKYGLYIQGFTLPEGPSSQYALTLQPGCYLVFARAYSGVEHGDTVRYLRVLPRWEEQPVTVEEMTGNLSRMLYGRSGRLPDGRLVHAGYDAAQNNIVTWTESPQGLVFHALPAGDNPITASCEPVLTGGVLHFGFSTGGAVQLVSCDGSSTVRPPQGLPIDDDQFCLVANGIGELAIFTQVDLGGTYDLVYYEASDLFNIQTVVSNINGGINGLDAVWNPNVNAYDICYGDAISLIWEQWGPQTLHLAGGGLYNFKVLGLDLETDPATGRSMMLTTLDVVPHEAWFMTQLETGFWSLPESPDAGLATTRYGDLLATEDGPYILNQLKDGADDYIRLYGMDGPGWEMLSEQVVTNHIESQASLIPAADGVTACLPLKDGTYAMRSFPQSGSPQDIYAIEAGQDGYRGELHATAGSDGLHAVWRNMSYGELEHLTSPDGATWTNQNSSIGEVTDIDIASTSEGEVYLSFIDVNSTELHYWDGAMWVQQQGYPGIAGYRPSLMSQPTDELMYWYVHLQPANSLRFVSGNQATPWGFVGFNPPMPTWQGTVMEGGFTIAGTKPRWFCLIGPSLGSSDLYFYDYNNSNAVSLGVDQGSIDYPQVYGRTMDSCLYMDTGGSRQSLWMVNTAGIMDSVLFKANSFNGQLEPHVVPVADPWEQLLSVGLRSRGVNMAQGMGRTALVLEAGLVGHDTKLVWSDFGEFSRLPLPDAVNPDKGAWICAPEIVVGTDGRWHIIYVDLVSNEIRCISTVQ